MILKFLMCFTSPKRHCLKEESCDENSDPNIAVSNNSNLSSDSSDKKAKTVSMTFNFNF